MATSAVSPWSREPSLHKVFIDTVDPTIVYRQLNPDIYGYIALKDSFKFNQGTHHWKFKLLADPSEQCGIQISGHETEIPHYYHFYQFRPGTAEIEFREENDKTGPAEVGHALGGGSYEYGIKCEKNDIIDFYVDMEKGSISFAINNEYYGKFHKGVAKCTYHVGVRLNGDKIKLLSYDNNKANTYGRAKL